MSDRSLHILQIGDVSLQDLQDVTDALARLAAGTIVRTAADVAGARQIVDEEGWHPDLVVVLQAWPDQYSESEVHDLIALCPLARIVSCYGPWCDSDGRTRTIWPPAVRVSAAAAQGRLAHELTGLRQRESASATLPLTASRAEIFEFDFDGPQVVESRPAALTMVVISPDRRWREMIASSLKATGVDVFDSQAEARPQAIIFDADPWDDVRMEALRAVRAKNELARIVIAVGFPRPDLEFGVFQSGADSVWFKLAPLQELHDELSHGRRGTAAHAP